MKVLSKRSSGMFMMFLSAVLLITVVISSIYYCMPDHTSQTMRTIRGFEVGESLASRAHHPDAHTADEQPSFYTSELGFPYRWLIQPLTIVGVVCLSVGFLLYRNELFNMF